MLRFIHNPFPALAARVYFIDKADEYTHFYLRTQVSNQYPTHGGDTYSNHQLLPRGKGSESDGFIVVADLDKDNLFFELAHNIKHGDKMAHFGLYGLLTYFVNRSTRFKSFNLSNYKILFGFTLVLTFAIAEEFSQLAFSNRTFDLLDMLCDVVGIWFFSTLWPFVIKKLKPN